MFYFSASKKKIEMKILTFNQAGLEVIYSSAPISYALQVQVLLKSCQTNLINSCYIAFCLCSSTWLGMSHSEDIQQSGLSVIFGWSTETSSSNFIAGRPKAVLLFWFFGSFRCGVSLFIVILVIYKYKNR